MGVTWGYGYGQLEGVLQWLLHPDPDLWLGALFACPCEPNVAGADNEGRRTVCQQRTRPNIQASHNHYIVSECPASGPQMSPVPVWPCGHHKQAAIACP